MKNKPYSTEDEPMPAAEEPVAAYGQAVGALSSFRAGNAAVSKPGRMTVEEFFGEVRSVLHKKYGDLQG